LLLGAIAALVLLGLLLAILVLGTLLVIYLIRSNPDGIWIAALIVAAVVLYVDAWRAIVEHDRQYENYQWDPESGQWTRCR
jgi:hypothetical protein